MSVRTRDIRLVEIAYVPSAEDDLTDLLTLKKLAGKLLASEDPMRTSPEDPEQGEETSVAKKIERGLREAIAIKQGEREAARQRQVLITADVADVPEPPEFTPAQIKRIRRELSVSQSVFADLLAVSGSTVAAWEQGDRSPGSSSRRLLELVETNPEVLMRSLERAAVASSDEFEELVERLAEQFADRGITRDDVEDAIRRARFSS